MNTRDVIISKILELSKEKYPDAEIYLYGSHARGDAKPFSDWDLYQFELYVSPTCA